MTWMRCGGGVHLRLLTHTSSVTCTIRAPIQHTTRRQRHTMHPHSGGCVFAKIAALFTSITRQTVLRGPMNGLIRITILTLAQ